MNGLSVNQSNKSTREAGIYRVTLTGSVVNLVLLLFKFFAGVAGHSAAMLADAVHSLSDFVTDIIVLVFVRLSSKPTTMGMASMKHWLRPSLASVCVWWDWVSCGTGLVPFGT